MVTSLAILVVAALRCPVPGAADDLADIQAARGLRVDREGDVVRGASTSGDPASACALLPPRHWPEQERALLSAEFPELTRLGCGVVTGEPWYMVLRRERRAAALRSPLTDAIEAGDAAGARAAIAAGADLERGIPCWRLHRAGPAAADRVQDTTPLALACRFGERAIVEALLAAGARADARLADGSTALMEAAARGDVEVVRALLAHGADPDARDRQGWTALVSALEQDRFDCAKELRGAGAGPPRGPAFREVVGRALRKSDGLARLSALIDLGAALAEVDGHGSIGLVELATRLPNALDLIPVLVGKGADVDRRSSILSTTPLQAAVLEDRRAHARALIAAGADLAIPSRGGWTIPMLALERAGADFARELIALGAPQGDFDVVRYRAATHARDFDAIERHARAGRDLDAEDAFGETALSAAERTGDLKLLRLLLDLGADPKAARPRQR